MKQPIELRRTRDFGEIINDTFTFLKENFKPLFTALLALCGFFVIAGTATTVLTQTNLMNMYTTKIDTNSYQAATPAISYFVSIMFNTVIIVLGQLSIYLVTLCYISVYLEKKDGKPTLPEVWGFFKYYFFRILGSGVLITILFAMGIVLCVIPGIYIMTIMSLIFPIIVMENTSFRYAFNKSFTLIKDNWWLVFGVIFIITLIVGILGSIASVPMSIIVTARLYLSLKGFTLPFIILFSLLQNLLTLAYALSAIAITFCYFSLSEQKEAIGILGRINAFGKSTDGNNDLPAEQY
ncbi:hypothetical protein [Mucilaginibacter sp. SP1R1]|uniref:hypothetical protein n=1 Tax=Mucilaginibacter sp. SP1R1 TaxID=2723091 RepID=UPI001616484B|nr:hypothetical protein [Mucilaginibacter sp. SP1R1]MBB6151246.1 hypothetical protein [Mucilaginibacter sp. SP1R1]